MSTSLRSKGSIKVIHVDDEATQLSFTKEFLEAEDKLLRVEPVDSAEEVLRRLSSKPDCIVTDYQMPDMDGIVLTRKIRKVSDVPVILYTGRGSEEVAKLAFAAGVSDYIQKGIHPTHYRILAECIRNVVEKWQSSK